MSGRVVLNRSLGVARNATTTNLRLFLQREAISIEKNELNKLFADREANRNKILQSQYLYAIMLCNYYCHDINFYDDYLQEIIIAINKSINKFEPEFGSSFSGFCNMQIKHALNLLRKNTGIPYANQTYLLPFIIEAKKNVNEIDTESISAYIKKNYPEIQSSIKAIDYFLNPYEFTSANKIIGEAETELVELIKPNYQPEFEHKGVFWNYLITILKKHYRSKWLNKYKLLIDFYFNSDYSGNSREYQRSNSIEILQILKRYKNLFSNIDISELKDYPEPDQFVECKNIPNSNYHITINGEVFLIENNKKKKVPVYFHKKSNRLFFKFGKTKRYLHRVVAELFLPNPNNLPLIIFKNADTNNCSVSNLEWSDFLPGNPTWNINTTQKGNTCNLSKGLTPEQIISIFNDIESISAIAKKHNISKSFVNLIKEKKRWKWLTKKL